METIQAIYLLASTTKRTEKEQILIEIFMRGNREFFIGAQLAYDALISFGVAKVAEIDDPDDSPGTFTFEDFLSLTHKLRFRQLTGHAARDAIREAAEQCHAPTWNYFYRRVLLKDLRCGLDSSTINKVLEKLAPSQPEAKSLIIPVFGCQLAKDGMLPEHAGKIKGKQLIDMKLDGVRLLTILDKEAGTVTQYARNGKINENFVEIREGLTNLLEELPGSIVLDGEIISSSFQALMKQFSRSVGKADTSKTNLALFDIIPLADFKANVCKIPQEDRHAILTALVGLLQKHTNDLVYVIPKLVIDLDTPEGQKTFKEFNKMVLDAGKEGIMVKNPKAGYINKRKDHWLKIKPFIEVSLEIVGVEEGKPGTKLENNFGAFVMRGTDDGKVIETNCGSGFSDEDRKEIWANKDKYIGMIGEVRADAMTLEQNSSVWSLRFPRWKGLRGTVPGEKL